MSTELTPTPEPRPDAYALLSKPTLELSDAEVEIIVNELRTKRALFVQDPKKNADKPKRIAAPAADKATKAANSLALLAQMGVTLDLKMPGDGK